MLKLTHFEGNHSWKLVTDGEAQILLSSRDFGTAEAAIANAALFGLVVLESDRASTTDGVPPVLEIPDH